MPEYQFANSKGEIITEDYDRPANFSAEQVLQSLNHAFSLFPYETQIIQVEGYEDVFCVEYPNGEFESVYICGKGTTPGGRQGLLNNEQRIQPKAKYLNYVYDKSIQGKKGVFLGVYSKDGQEILCTWKLMQSNAASIETPISKQIKIDSIAKAIREGFVQQDKGRGEFACVFKPEFLYFYLKNSDWLHTGPVSELAEHTESEIDSETSVQKQNLIFSTGIESKYARNRIIFGAPGTGKSYSINQERADLIGDNNETDYERVTFHPDYSYANFVGTYKPVMVEGQELIQILSRSFLSLQIKAERRRRSTIFCMIDSKMRDLLAFQYFSACILTSHSKPENRMEAMPPEIIVLKRIMVGLSENM